MSRLGCVALVVGAFVVAVGGFAALLYWSLVVNQDDQSALTLPLEATVVSEPDRVGSAPSTTWRFDYAYETDGQWYGAEGDVSPDVWSPGDALRVCVDPSAPSQHVIAFHHECGEEFIRSGSIDEATPRQAP